MYKHLKHWKRIRRSHLKLGLLLFTSLHLNDKSVLPTSLPARPDLRSPPKSRCILRIFSKQYILVVPLIYFREEKKPFCDILLNNILLVMGVSNLLSSGVVDKSTLHFCKTFLYFILLCTIFFLLLITLQNFFR